MSDFHNTLNAQHYAAVPLTLSKDDLALGASAFLNFLRLPPEVKYTLHVPPTVHRQSAFGYTDKLAIENKDPKEFFHWTPDLLNLESYKKAAEEHIEIQAFFEHARHIYTEAEQTLCTLFTAYLPEVKFYIFNDDDTLKRGILRFLSYAPQKSAAMCAKAHFDKGFATLALSESAPGLRIGCCEKHPLHTIAHKENTAIFMPAMSLFEATEGEIKPSWHDVLHSPSEHNVTDFCARWAIVFFCNSPDIPYSSWDAVHTPLH